ncbi:MAG: cytidylate kinase-like family protein [Phycisphaerales bacterium]|nr:cytidylate kinase-like family protein [Phycisphaerales bacterium]
MSTIRSKSVSAAVERQMRNWELARQQEITAPETSAATQPFVTISRMVGSGGTEVARHLAAAIDWPLFDRELLLHMSGDDGVRQRIYETLDERDQSFIEESLLSFTTAEFRRNDYFRRLTETMLALVRHGHAIFLGRGADLVLPRGCGLRVRVVSLPALCAQAFAERTGMSAIDAAREIERIEQQRSRFIRSHFHEEPDAPDRFDLVANLASLSVDETVEMILAVMRKRGLL